MRNLNKKGFTLIEVMATVAIASLVMVALVSFLSVVSKVFIASAIESEQRLIVSSAKAYLKKELTYAENVTININNDKELTYNINQKLEFIDGKIYDEEGMIFDDKFYGNTRIYGEVRRDGSVLTFNLRVVNGETVRTEEYAIKTLNSN